MNTIDLSSHNTLFVAHGIIERGHSFVNLLFTFKLHYRIHIEYLITEMVGVMQCYALQIPV